MKKFILFFFILYAHNNYSYAKSGWIGIEYILNTSKLKEDYLLATDKGLLISSIFQKSPADIAGLKAGDIIISVDNNSNIDSEIFKNILSNKSAGDIIELEILRENNLNKKIKLKLEDIKNFKENAAKTSESEKFSANLYWPGWSIKTPEQKISKIYYFSNPEIIKKYETGNWVITCLDKRSDLYKKGVKLYDEVVSINDQPTNLYKYSNKPFNITIKRNSQILKFRNISPLIYIQKDLDFTCVPEFANMICTKLLFENIHNKEGKIDKELRKKNDLAIFQCCEKNNVSYLPFLQEDEGRSLRLDFFKFFLSDLVFAKEKSAERLELSKYVKIAEVELKKIESIKQKFPDYKLPDSYYSVVDLLKNTNLYAKGFSDDLKIDYKEKENLERLKSRINEKINNNEHRDLGTLKLVDNNLYFLLQSLEYEYLENILKIIIQANYSQNNDEYINLLGIFYSGLSEIYFKQSDLKKLTKNNKDIENWLKTKPTSIHTRIINKKILTGAYHSTLLLDANNFVKEFKNNGWKKIDNYLNEFYTLSPEDQKSILKIDDDYLYDGYFYLTSHYWVDFSDQRYDYYALKALDQLELKSKKEKYRKIYVYTALLMAASWNNDEIMINKTLLDIKKFLIDAKGDDDYLIAMRNNIGNLYNFYSSKLLYAELEDFLFFFEKNFKINPLEKNFSNLYNNVFYFYGKSDIERNKNNYIKSVEYLEKIINNPQFDLSVIFSAYKNNNINNIDLMQQMVLTNILPDLFDGYYKIGNFDKIKKITFEGLGVNINNIQYKNLDDILLVLHPIRILNPLLSYYLNENNLEKALMVANFIENNLDKISRQNTITENPKRPTDFTYNANELIKINNDKLALKLYDKAIDLVLLKYNDIFYNSIWRTTSNDVNSAVDFLEGAKLMNSNDFFNKAFNTAQIIKNSNFSREILKAYLSKQSGGNPALIEYHNLQAELISLTKMEEIKLTRSADYIAQNKFKKEFEEKKYKFNLIEDKIRFSNPEFFKSIKVEGIKVKDIQSKLKKNQAVIDYYFSDNKLAIVIIKDNSYNIHIENISINNLQNIKNNIRNTLQISKNGKLVPFDLKNSFKLNELVFLNIKKYLDNINYLFVVPHGPLNEIPIHTLPKNNGTSCTDCSNVEWNFSDYTFNYLASLDSFQGSGNDEFFAKILKENFRQVYSEFESNKDLKKIKDNTVSFLTNIFKSPEGSENENILQRRSKIKYLGIGDPDLYVKSSKKDKTAESLNFEKLIALRSLNLNSDIRSINIQDFYSPLKSSREEIIFAAKAFGEDNSKIWLKENATETNLKETDLKNFNIIHFATHAEVSGAMKGLNEPFLVLSPPKEKSAKDNGLLMMNEIMQLNLNADLVILSACNTGSVEDEYSGSYSGLAKAFFVAGAKSVLVSNWYVEDAATQRLIQKFTENMSKDKGNFAENLNLTMKELSKQKSQYSHPIFWAPFVFVGTDLEINNKLN